MKKIVLILSAIVMIFCLTGCSKEKTLMKNPWEYGGAVYSFKEGGILLRNVKGVEASGVWSLSEDEKLTFTIDKISGTYTFDFVNKNLVLKKPNNETVEWKVFKGDIKKLPAGTSQNGGNPDKMVETIE